MIATPSNFLPLGPTAAISFGSAYARTRHSPNSGSPPSYPSLPTAKGDPDLIIITSWTGALPKHIEKYTQAYSDLYSNCPILLITTSIQDLTLRSDKRKHDDLEPVVKYIESQILHRRTQHYNIFLHALSEGGSNKAVTLAKAFLKHTGYRLPIAASIYDSTPGTARFSNNIAAYKRSLPHNPAVRFFGLMFGVVVLAITFFFHRVLVRGDADVLARTRRAINDSTLWPVTGIPRTYVFSEADDLIWWRDIVEHAELSAQKFGVLSLVVKYNDTAHCHHMRDNVEFYWSLVKKTWESRTGIDIASLGSIEYKFGQPQV
jgi:hypothetical protein